MAVVCKIELEYDSEATAERIQRSVELDNDEHLASCVSGKMLVAEAKAASLKSLLHTLDDFLSCVSIAEGVVRGKG